MHEYPGTIKWFDEEKGCGFIIPDDGSKDVFFKFSVCMDTGVFSEGERVLYKFNLPEPNKEPVATSVSRA